MRLAFARFTFDSDTRELLEDGVRVHVSPKAFDLLRLLLERRPAVVSKAEIHDRIWPGAFVGDANLSVLIAELRQVLHDDSKDAQFVRTAHRVGYAFSGPVTDVSGQADPRTSAAQRYWLVWNDATFTLSPGENVVGRDPRSTVWVDVSGVSRRHARIEVSDAGATIEDLASSNGTFVGGVRLCEPRRLADRDEIELGAATVTFRTWSDEDAAKTERISRRKR